MFTMVMRAWSFALHIYALFIIIYIGSQTEVISNTRCSLKVSFEPLKFMLSGNYMKLPAH